MRETLPADVPHRQVVLAVPKRLRPYLLYHRVVRGFGCLGEVSPLLASCVNVTGPCFLLD